MADSRVGFLRRGQPAPPHQQVCENAVSSPSRVRAEPLPPNDFPVFRGLQAAYFATILRLKVPQMQQGGG